MQIRELQPNCRSMPRELHPIQLNTAALEAVSKRGFSETTHCYVTEKAGRSQSLINHHFACKAAQSDAARGVLAQEHYDKCPLDYDPTKPRTTHRLEAIISADCDPSDCPHQRLAVWFAVWRRTKRQPGNLRKNHEFPEEYKIRIPQHYMQDVARNGCDDLPVS